MGLFALAEHVNGVVIGIIALVIGVSYAAEWAKDKRQKDRIAALEDANDRLKGLLAALTPKG